MIDVNIQSGLGQRTELFFNYHGRAAGQTTFGSAILAS